MTVYFEIGYSILSSLGISNALSSLLVIGILGVSRLSLVPLIVSVACAIANALAYYSFYTHHEVSKRVAASVISDVAWLIQEIGLNFYSYFILKNLLELRRRATYLTGFWALVLSICSIRVAIAVTRAREIIYPQDLELQRLLSHIHIGYFIGMALLESWSSYFLLNLFASARRESRLFPHRDPKARTWRYLIRSTEIRVGSLALIGIARACTYSFVDSPIGLSTAPSQVDRFFYCLESMFPVIMMIDLLASKLPSSHRAGRGHDHCDFVHTSASNDVHSITARRASSKPDPLDRRHSTVMQPSNALLPPSKRPLTYEEDLDALGHQSRQHLIL